MAIVHEGNKISQALRAQLKTMKWSPNNFMNLHAQGVHWFNPDYMPAHTDPLTYATLWRRGLTPPMALPLYFPDDTQARIKSFIDNNYFKLTQGGLAYLGNEYNLQDPSEYDKKPIRICFMRLSDYETMDGAFGSQLVNNFIQDFSEDVYADFAWVPHKDDLPKFLNEGLPICFGYRSKRPLWEFDIIFIGTSYPSERLNLPFTLTRSGLPLYRWERHNPELPYRERGLPLIALAGIGATSVESAYADNPIHGIGQNAMVDCAIIGEGEVIDYRLIYSYLQSVKSGKMSADEWLRTRSNEHFRGFYDPTKVLFEYADKKVVEKDFEGTVLRETVYPAAGNIKKISMVDHETKTKHIIAGEGSEEFADMAPINDMFHIRYPNRADMPRLAQERYVKISEHPSMLERRNMGFRTPTAEDRAKAHPKVFGHRVPKS